MRTDHRWIAVAIFAAGAMIALALYAALRPREEPAAVAQPAARNEPPPPKFREIRSDPQQLDEEKEGHAAPMATDEPTRGSRAAGVADRSRMPADPAQAIAPPFPAALTPSSTAVQQATDALEDAVADARADIRSKCWNELATSENAPSEVTLHLSVSFGKDGNVIASGVSEDREARLDGLAQCVTPLVHGLEIPPPGGPVPVELSITVP